MKYAGMPSGMWLLFSASFKKQLICVLGLDTQSAKACTAKAHLKYKEIITALPEFEKEDRFKMNSVNCAMFSAFLLSLPQKPSLENATLYYNRAMMIAPMRWFCQLSGKSKFTDKDIAGMKAAAALRAADRNPYSFNMDYLPYPDGSGYEARFLHCGICTLMRKLGLASYIPAMCKLDYAMSEAGGASTFIRKYTLGSGGPYCDCGYKKK